MSGTTLLNSLNTPGVYIQEIPVLPASIVSVPTAVPVFVGYTQMATEYATGDLIGKPFSIESMLEYQQYFGGPFPETGVTVAVDDTQPAPVAIATLNEATRSKYVMYYSLQMYFANGGSTCYILCINLYNATSPVINEKDYLDPVSTLFCPILQKYNDITLVVCPDSLGLPHSTTLPDTGDQVYYALQTAVIAHCVLMQNRLAVMDVYPLSGANTPMTQIINALRNADGNENGLQVPLTENYKYGAAYYPRILSTLSPTTGFTDPTTGLDINYNLVSVTLKSTGATATMDTLKSKNGQVYNAAKTAISNLQMLLPAAPAVVGVYANIDETLGVWNAPANVQITNAAGTEHQISAQDQGSMNVDPVTGLSVNAIRSFPGRGAAVIWGARTLAGNDNEWRYVSVRRFFFMVEQSVKNAVEPLVFSTNDNNTWTRVKAMVGNYLTGLWRMGALMGTTTKDAFYVYVGLGETMTETDIWEGRMIVQIGLSVVRPAEFIILQFMQMMQTTS
jgi:phage tail sheath protein FI